MVDVLISSAGGESDKELSMAVLQLTWKEVLLSLQTTKLM